jgi:hypothetical protein
MRRIILPSLLALLLSGCFITEFTLGPREQAQVNPAYVGDWIVATDDPQEPSLIIIRSFNDREYYVEMLEGHNITRMAGFIITVNGIDFAHLRGLTDDGSIDREHLIMRIAVDGNRLTLRNLDPDFFGGVDSDEALRQRVEQNLDNPRMYHEHIIFADRAATPSA